MNKVCVTIIFGDYDILKDPTVISDNWKYIVISDRDHKSSVWKTEKLKLDSKYNLTNKQKTGYVMTQIYKIIDYDVCLMVGGQIQINTDLNNYIFDNDFVALEHPIRNCIYKEAMACIMLNKDNPKKIATQVHKYLDEGLPVNSGMIQTGITIRKRNKRINKFCDMWWEQILMGSQRDQLSFNFVNWKLPIDYKTIDSNLLNKEFQLHPHNDTIRTDPNGPINPTIE